MEIKKGVLDDAIRTIEESGRNSERLGKAIMRETEQKSFEAELRRTDRFLANIEKEKLNRALIGEKNSKTDAEIYKKTTEKALGDIKTIKNVAREIILERDALREMVELLGKKWGTSAPDIDEVFKAKKNGPNVAGDIKAAAEELNARIDSAAEKPANNIPVKIKP